MLTQKGNFLPVLAIGILLILVAGGAYYVGTQTGEPRTVTINETSEPVSTASATPVIADSLQTYMSLRCNFTVKAPKDWIIADGTGKDIINYNQTCTKVNAPDLKIEMDSYEGLMVSIYRTPLGTVYETSSKTVINSVADYIKGTETIIQPAVSAKNVESRTYGAHSGTYFEYEARDNVSHFVFENGEYIYSVQWKATYTGSYLKDIDGIIGSLTF